MAAWNSLSTRPQENTTATEITKTALPSRSQRNPPHSHSERFHPFERQLHIQNIAYDRRVVRGPGAVKLGRTSVGVRKMRRAILSLAISMAFALAAPTNAQFGSGLGTIQGTVVDSQGKPVEDASVTIQTSDGQHPHATHTDTKGSVWTAY